MLELLKVWIDKNTRRDLRDELKDRDVHISAFRHFYDLDDTDDVDIISKVGFDLVRVPNRHGRVVRFWDQEDLWLRNLLGIDKTMGTADVIPFPKAEKAYMQQPDIPYARAAEDLGDYGIRVETDPRESIKVRFWQTCLDHYSLYGIDDLEKGSTYSAPQFVDQYGSFSSFLNDTAMLKSFGAISNPSRNIFISPCRPKERHLIMMHQQNGFNSNDVAHRRQEVQQAIKNACDELNSDGVDPRDYVEQLAWMFFLKAFDETETRLENEAAFDNGGYTRRLSGEYSWAEWSKKIERPDEMLEFVNGKLWKKLRNIGDDAVGERFRRVFTVVRNHSRRGVSFARVVQQVNSVRFGEDTDVIVLSEIYERLLKDVAADSAGYAGEFYTQRHIIRLMVEVVKPKIGDRIYDPCFGTAGFLAESADYIRNTSQSLASADLEKLQNETFYGMELKDRTFLFGNMNMLLHRIEGANLEMANTLEVHSANVPEKNKYDVILSNPPYGGKMARECRPILPFIPQPRKSFSFSTS